MPAVSEDNYVLIRVEGTILLAILARTRALRWGFKGSNETVSNGPEYMNLNRLA